jgi:opacity protein-like surface antigen
MRRLNYLCSGKQLMAAGALVAGAIFGMSGSANADGMPAAAPRMQAPANWSGFYFGVNSGWAWSDIGSTITATGDDGVGGDSVQHDAPAVGGQLGIQGQFGNIVLGVEGTLLTTFRDGFANTACPVTTRTCGKRFDDVLTIGPRIGWSMGHWMPYITGGYANAAFSHESFDTGTVANVRLAQDRFNGWYIGAGFDMALAQGWTIGLEYRHYEFDGVTLLSHTPAGALNGDVRTVDPSLDSLLVRVSWKLGPPPPPAAPLK